jgi:uncharacterized integral membrane protein
MKTKTIAILAALGIFVIILIQNMEATIIQLLFWSISMPLLILLLACVSFGWILGWFTHLAYFSGKYKNQKMNTDAKTT